MTLARYASIVIALVGTSVAVVWPLVARTVDADAGRAAAFGAALAAANTVAAYGLVLWSASRSPNVFLGAVLGGMVGRMAVLLAAVVAAILLLGLPKLPLAISLLSYFVVFLVVELAIVQKHTTPVSR